MNRKLTIGLFNDSFYPMSDGVISVVDNYARRLSNYANVIVFAPRYFHQKFDDSTLPYKVIRCRSIKVPGLDYSLPLPKLDSKFRKEFSKYKLDIVHIHSPFLLGNQGIRYAKKNNIFCYATMHTQFEQDAQKVLKSKLISKKFNHLLIKQFEQCDECWAVNSAVAKIYHEEYGYSKMPKVMNNATEMKPVSDIKKACDYINGKYNISPDEKVFLFVGRINTLKNILFIADVIAEIKKKSPNLKFKMLYVGSGLDEDKLRKHINTVGISDCTIMCGKVSDRELLSYYYARADLFLFPSVYDASSIVQIEAASQSTPTVFIKGSATSATATDNVNGFFSDYTVNAFSNKVIEVMKNKELYNMVSKNCFRDLYKNWDDTIEEVFSIYQSTLNNKTPSVSNVS